MSKHGTYYKYIGNYSNNNIVLLYLGKVIFLTQNSNRILIFKQHKLFLNLFSKYLCIFHNSKWTKETE